MLRRSFLRGCLSIAAGCVLSRLPLVGPRVEAVSLEGSYVAGIDLGAGKDWTAWVPEPAGGWDRSYGMRNWCDGPGKWGEASFHSQTIHFFEPDSASV